MQRVGVDATCEFTVCNAIKGGWVLVHSVDAPAPSCAGALLAEGDAPDMSCLVYGQLEEGSTVDLLAAYREGGAEAVRRLEGMFAALIVDKRSKTLTVVSSVVGCRYVHFKEEAGSLYLSSTLAALATALSEPLKLDHAAIGATIAAGWPLAGASPAEGVARCDSLSQLKWEAGELTSTTVNPLALMGRLEAANRAGVERQLMDVIEILREGLRQAASAHCNGHIRAALTAGMDSRAVVALACSVAKKADVEVYTRGPEESLDVRVAKRLARLFGVRHVHVKEVGTPTDDFQLSARRFALLADGAYTVAPALSTSRTSGAGAFSGGAAEVYRGYYYPYLRRLRRTAEPPNDLMRALLKWPLKRIDATPFAAPDFQQATRRQLRRSIEQLQHISCDLYDLADLFYVYERLSRWAAWSWRVAAGPSLVPFANGTALAAAFALPAPVGDHALVARIVKELAPAGVYWAPVNGRELLALQGRGLVRYGARELARLTGKTVDKVTVRLRPGSKDLTALRQTRLAQEHRELLRATLLAPDSIGRDLFAVGELERACEGESILNRSSALGVLLCSELWVRELRSAHADE